ncbi:predicted protein [Postia placenta Mad-698-R]|uniref:NADH:flavin oxidoreductase/NADH oxidase N-terminal domain-containing protein n=1 Tax=Postia placenta MAD-698-R-SB12 TaxID=670580 RepID=A0A1X6N0T3_9APHY|nr:hypothetical protein POSPLADRAFT_1143135 [Postia placenta MAD-698-R-SB12]EED82233.1 predicted protein [Postia placenta Mad-698-R]OSX62227.1 hypothetical protein POSPLADRAFT_1143135 [Postia placenta MAD-698-R-SB12]
MSTTVVPKLFQPTKVGKTVLAHRVVMSPMTRCRANAAHVHGDLAGTIIAGKAGGIPFVPGIWNDEQVAAWKRVTDAVHAKGSRIFCQLWAIGRAAVPQVLAAGGYELVSASDIPAKPDSKVPRALTIPGRVFLTLGVTITQLTSTENTEIKEYIQLYTDGALNAVRAGFDGVELHGASGYLIDQFTQDVSNKRTDEYGGSIENRCRFALEIIESVSKAIGADKVGIKFGPWVTLQGMRMADPKPTFAYLVSRIKELYPKFAYIHVMEPRVDGNVDREVQAGESNDFLREIWLPRTYIGVGGYTRDDALGQCEKTGELIAFARSFISNPDLPLRLAKNLPLTKGKREDYTPPFDGKGYIDFPFAEDRYIQNFHLSLLENKRHSSGPKQQAESELPPRTATNKRLLVASARRFWLTRLSATSAPFGRSKAAKSRFLSSEIPAVVLTAPIPPFVPLPQEKDGVWAFMQALLPEKEIGRQP